MGPNNRILHHGKLDGSLTKGETVHTSLKWGRRLRNMRAHSGGHLVHDVLMSLTESLTPTKANHGSKAFLEYAGQLNPAIKDQLEAKVNELVAQDLLIVTRDATYDEIVQRCRFVPPNLPRKGLRLLQIGDFTPMPDAGVQAQGTAEIGRLIIHSISSANGVATIRYGVSMAGER